MDTILMNFENSRTPSINYIWKNIKNSYRNNKFKISVPTWNEAFDLPDISYSVSNIEDCLSIS